MGEGKIKARRGRKERKEEMLMTSLKMFNMKFTTK
jgi:hypothetical protein